MDAVGPPKPKVLFEAEPFIPYMREADFDHRLKPVVEDCRSQVGFLPNAYKLYAWRPEIAEALWRLERDIMGDPSSTLDRFLKRKLAAVACAVECNAPGLTLWSRKPAVRGANSEFDAPLAWRYDESDSMVLCENVKVPWEKVFVHDDPLLSRDIYIKTPSHCFGNHQSNVRYWSKMRLLLGLCSKVAHATGADQVPAVRETLGKMAAVEATIAGLVHGQINAWEAWPPGYACFNRRIMYAGLDWCTQNYSSFIDELRTLCGGGVFQMPADISIMEDKQLANEFSTYWQTPQADSLSRMKLFKLAWDMVGSEFAGRHLQYEKFYAGASFIIRNHSYRETDWAEFNCLVDDFMARYDYQRTDARKQMTDVRGQMSEVT